MNFYDSWLSGGESPDHRLDLERQFGEQCEGLISALALGGFEAENIEAARAGHFALSSDDEGRRGEESIIVILGPFYIWETRCDRPDGNVSRGFVEFGLDETEVVVIAMGIIGCWCKRLHVHC